MKIIKDYKQNIPTCRFIGKKYFDEDRHLGGFGHKWDEWFENEYFETLACDEIMFEDSDAYIGLMRWKENEPFEYWIGKFMPEGTPVPEGFEHVDFSAHQIGICWYQGPMDELFAKENLAADRLKEQGHQIKTINEATWFYERYNHKRFTQDENGHVILDVVFMI